MQELIQYQHNEEIESPLVALRNGKPVVLSVADADMKTRRRTPHPRLVITPLPTGELCVALESMGCEIAEPENFKVARLWRMGLTKNAAEMLISEIKSNTV